MSLSSQEYKYDVSPHHSQELKTAEGARSGRSTGPGAIILPTSTSTLHSSATHSTVIHSIRTVSPFSKEEVRE